MAHLKVWTLSCEWHVCREKYQLISPLKSNKVTVHRSNLVPLLTISLNNRIPIVHAHSSCVPLSNPWTETLPWILFMGLTNGRTLKRRRQAIGTVSHNEGRAAPEVHLSLLDSPGELKANVFWTNKWHTERSFFENTTWSRTYTKS